jgi:hypothetical protein
MSYLKQAAVIAVVMAVVFRVPALRAIVVPTASA